MELRKYRELEELPKLRILKRPGDNIKPKWNFTTIILTISVIVSFIAFFSQVEKESKNEESLQDFVERSVSGDGQKIEKFILAKTTPKQIEKIKELIGIDVTAYRWTISSSDIRHIWNKPAHAISIDEILKVYSIINTYDYFALSTKQRKDVILIEIYKLFSYKLTCIVEVRKGKKELVIITMYKNKLK